MTSLVHKKTGEWGLYLGDGEIGTSSIPKIMIAKSKKQLIKYAKIVDSVDVTEKLKDYDLVKVKVSVKKKIK